MHQFDQYSLGESQSELELETREHNQQASQALVQQARRRVDIASRYLDPWIYDQPEFIEGLKRAILDNHRIRVRVIVFAAQAIARRGHQMLQLAGDLSSFIELRQAAREHGDYNEDLLVVDGCGYIHRLLGTRYEASASFSDRRAAQAQLNNFDVMWEPATPSPHLRRLTL